MVISGATCDMCGNVKYMQIKNKGTTIRLLRYDGWTIGKRVLCPSCASVKKSKGGV